MDGCWSVMLCPAKLFGSRAYSNLNMGERPMCQFDRASICALHARVLGQCRPWSDRLLACPGYLPNASVLLCLGSADRAPGSDEISSCSLAVRMHQWQQPRRALLRHRLQHQDKDVTPRFQASRSFPQGSAVFRNISGATLSGVTMTARYDELAHLTQQRMCSEQPDVAPPL